MPPVSLSSTDFRRLHVRAAGLGTSALDVGVALRHHGYVQIDPINVCGRMQDLILRNRVAGYREGDLFRHVHGEIGAPLAAEQRSAFEHHLPRSHVLVVLPVEAWPYLKAAMRDREGKEGVWSGKLDERERLLAPRLLEEIERRGALASEDIDDGQRTSFGWGSRSTLAKSVLQKLFFHGHVLIGCREGGRRYYDLPGRVLPAAILQAPEPSAVEIARWTVLLKLKQRRVARLTRQELHLVHDLVLPLTTERGKTLYLLQEDQRWLDIAVPDRGPLLLAPLDPLIYDRELTRELWDFDYTWEVYTPAAKRVRGYYALPLLSDFCLAGHVDLKADRAAGRLRVMGRTVKRGHRSAEAVRDLSRFLGLKV